MPRPRRRLASTCIGTVAAGLLATGAALATPEEQSAGSDIAMGAYLDYGPPGVARIPFLSHWLGGKEIRVGHTYLPGDQWSGIEGNVSFLEDWAEWRLARDDRMFVLNVPMQERNEARIPDYQVAQLIRAGADGQYDRHFKKLAERLVALEVPDTVIVLGWEMNGTTYTHRCGPDPENWKAYWKRIVNTMRSVPGQDFKFDFTPNRGTDAIGWTKCYPGDDVVDIVGMDSYDQGPGRNFDEQISQPYGLQQHVDFAKAHGKETSYPEWGLFRNGDNPEYVRRMLKWIEQQKPLYHTITDYCPHGVWQCKQNPASTKVFREALTPQRPDPVIPTPVIPTPVVPTPVVPTPVVPSPQIPTPEVPTPVVTPPVVLPSPEVPTPVEPSPVVPSPAVPSPLEPSPVVPSPAVPVPSPVVPSPEVPVEPSPAVPSPAVPSPVEPSPLVPSPVEPSPLVPAPEVSPVVPEVPASPSPSPVVPKPEPEVPSPAPSPLVPKPEPSQPTTPPVNSKQWCVPINFGEWLSKLVGKQSVCVKIDWGQDTGFWPF